MLVFTSASLQISLIFQKEEYRQNLQQQHCAGLFQVEKKVLKILNTCWQLNRDHSISSLCETHLSYQPESVFLVCQNDSSRASSVTWQSTKRGERGSPGSGSSSSAALPRALELRWAPLGCGCRRALGGRCWRGHRAAPTALFVRITCFVCLPKNIFDQRSRGLSVSMFLSLIIQCLCFLGHLRIMLIYEHVKEMYSLMYV